VQPEAEARVGCGEADPFRGGEVEEAGIGEDVDEVGQALRGDRRDHLVRDARGMIHGGGCLRRDGVRPEERGDHPDRQVGCQATEKAEVTELLAERQPVAGLALHRRGARGESRPQARLDERRQRCVIGRPGRAHRAQDAAIGVRSAFEPCGGLVGSVPGEDRMGVAVHEPGRDQRAADVDPVLVRGVGRVADPRDPAVLDSHGPRRAAGRGQAAGAGQQHRLR
jgi:hypothetical protein